MAYVQRAMATTDVTLRYMTRFRCITDRCEDNCCNFPGIPMTEQSYRRLEQVLVAEGRAEELSKAVQLNPGGPPGQFALFRKREDRYCHFNDEKLLCSLHARHGESVLPDVCMLFPRKVYRWPERVEMSASMACPEAMRLSLLAEDAMDEVPAPEGSIPRPEVAVVRPGASAPRHSPWHERLRQAMRRVLSERQFPLASRLALIGLLSYRLDAVLGSSESPPAAELEAALAAFEDPSRLEQVHQALGGMAVDPLPQLGSYLRLLGKRLYINMGQRFDPFAPVALANLGVKKVDQADLPSLWQAYTERSTRLEAAHGARLEQYLRHYALNYLYSSPMVDRPTLLASVYRLGYHLGLMRLMLMGHPQVVALCAQPPESAELAQIALDAAAVETFQILNKSVLFTGAFIQETEQQEKAGADGLLQALLGVVRGLSTAG